MVRNVDQVIVPYYFNHTIVNICSYLSLLNVRFLSMLLSLSPDITFRQNGAPPIYRICVSQLLDEKLLCFWIGKRFPLPSLARSTESTPVALLIWW